MPAFFEAGNPVIFIDRKEHSFYSVLETGKVQNIKGDLIRHDEVIGQPDGVVIYSQRKKPVRVFKPTISEHVRLMPRGATIIYPKDIAMILIYGDIFPGAKVVEAGLGSGAMTTGLLRAVGENGQVVSYEIREDFINNARKNLVNFLGGEPRNHLVRTKDIYEQFEDGDADRVVLDLPEPGRALECITPTLQEGALVSIYLPTILQVKDCVDALHKLRCYTQIQTIELLEREWKVDAISVRPSQRMIGHTAFLTFARRTSIGTKPVQPAKYGRLEASGLISGED